MTDIQTPLVIRWYFSQFGEFEPWQERRVVKAASMSTILLELAYESCGPPVPWSPRAACMAAARGTQDLLRWLLSQNGGRNQTELAWTHGNCRPGCLMLLAHGHGWLLDNQHQLILKDAEQCRLAFYGAARRLRMQPSSRCSLGSLPEPLLKQIACLADLDFSWTFTR